MRSLQASLWRDCVWIRYIRANAVRSAAEAKPGQAHWATNDNDVSWHHAQHAIAATRTRAHVGQRRTAPLRRLRSSTERHDKRAADRFVLLGFA
jgi:hypothetical protein